ncbi:RNA methyltransferase [Intestinimonas massiliensis]|uniref:RNA methyltransferase n=1 Tax=Intestinimonas massiliensis (ex Afouda et al. 2020) TaxID=1673721 RepID=A0ABS9M4E8_9FIRM|nr:RNA methyltransferase [Intestinimonas massiliensis (ex Afouda et al. 2020)]MCG4525553.1 RNA methyltransferase [Intestinimonas massiliensis (ex Afouda et al. 2020)]MCQ4806596.1 RNA methyltransferase [Intestinimonas massiliensis (ex Afouda et al. 2020)]
MERITSRKNELAAYIRKLSGSRSARRAAGEFVCDGPKLLAEALKWGAAVTTVVAEEGTSLPELPSAVRRVEVPADLLRSLSTTETPQGVLFLCRTPDLALPERLTGGRYMVLDGVQDPGNLGTVWRTADAFGADGLVLVHSCADPWSPKTVRATMGACFRLPVWEADLHTLQARLDEGGVPLYATALREDTEDLRAQDLRRCAVVIGSEGRGVSEETLALCGKTLKIPMRTRCESLNAAVAAAVVLWEMAR